MNLRNFFRDLLGYVFIRLLGPARHRKTLGFASIYIVGSGITLTGDIRTMRMTNTQEVDIKFEPRDIHNNLTDNYEHGSETFVVLSGDDAIIEIIRDANCPLAATLRATGKNGVVQVGASVNGDPGDGRDMIVATLAIEIVSSRARSLKLATGVAREIELAPPQQTAEAARFPYMSNAQPPQPINKPNELVKQEAVVSNDLRSAGGGVVQPQPREWEWIGGSAKEQPQGGDTESHPCTDIYKSRATGEMRTVWNTRANHERMPAEVSDINSLVTDFGAIILETPLTTATDAEVGKDSWKLWQHVDAGSQPLGDETTEYCCQDVYQNRLTLERRTAITKREDHVKMPMAVNDLAELESFGAKVLEAWVPSYVGAPDEAQSPGLAQGHGERRVAQRRVADWDPTAEQPDPNRRQIAERRGMPLAQAATTNSEQVGTAS